MLRSDHSIVRYDFSRQRVLPDRLRRGRDDDYLTAAKICLSHYRHGAGQKRQELHRAVDRTLTQIGNCPPRRIAAFCKLLDDASTYLGDGKSAVKLRKRVFEAAAPLHPIVTQREGIFEHDLATARKQVSESIGKSWDEIAAALFGDVIELQTLESFDDSISPPEFLSRYNVAQTQAALYRASHVIVDARSDFQTIVMQAKLAGLMHRIDRISEAPPSYRFQFDGPGSALRKTTRYGIRFAQMIPTLLHCRDWSLRAEVLGPGQRPMSLHLSPRDGLRTGQVSPSEFDSGLEQEIDEIWQKQPIPGWTWHRESDLLSIGQTVLTPDFVLRQSQTGRKILIEVVGFWTPEYLADKCSRLKQFMDAGENRSDRASWLLIFAKAPIPEPFASLGVPILLHDKKTSPQDWMNAVEA